MKKFLLTLSLCLATVMAWAQNLSFNEDIAVTLNQEQDGEMVEAPLGATPGKINVTKNSDGTCDFLLPNFILSSADGDIPVGNIRL